MPKPTQVNQANLFEAYMFHAWNNDDADPSDPIMLEDALEVAQIFGATPVHKFLPNEDVQEWKFPDGSVAFILVQNTAEEGIIGCGIIETVSNNWTLP